MKAYVFYTSIAGPQYSTQDNWGVAWFYSYALLTKHKQSNVYVYDCADSTWCHLTNGGHKAYTEDFPEADVPKVYRLLLALEI